MADSTSGNRPLLSPRSHRILVPAALLAVLALVYVERGRGVRPSPWHDEMLRAAETSAAAAAHLKRQRLERGVFVDPVNDPAETALIGQEYTQITTDRGYLEAKLASLDPNFAAVVVDMLRELGIESGDCVAAAMTGSFPALNLSVLAGLETLGARPVVISSVGASNFGATDPYFTWLDMEREVSTGGILKARSLAASLGGGLDTGRGLSPKGRQLLREAIERNGVRLLEAPRLEDNIRQRMELYREGCDPQPVAAFVNVGGGIASLGHSLNSELIPIGASRTLVRRNFPARGALLRFAEDGVPVVHLSSIRRLRDRYGLQAIEDQVPPPGRGLVYGEVRYSLLRTSFVTALIVIALIALFLHDRHVHRLGGSRERGPGDTLKAASAVVSLFGPALIGLALFVGAPVAFAQQTVPIFVSGLDREYELLPTTEPRVITVRGPGELRLVSRARFKPTSSDALGYSLRFRIDGGAEQEVVYKDVGRSMTAMFRDGTLGVPGQLMDHRLDLRRGYHNIEIRPGSGGPQIFFRYLFKPRREKRRQWVALTPLEAPELVELVSREALVDYYRNPAGQPFHIEVIGPTELRIFTRVECSPEMRGRIHYRLQVREGEQVINTFQLSSRRSEVASYRTEDTLVPGRAAEVVIPVPAGRHRLQILPMDPDKSTLLARFMLPREDLALTAE